MSDNGNEKVISEKDNFSREGLEEKLELLKQQRDSMLEQANRQMAQMDGAIGFLEQFLSGEIDEPLNEGAPAEVKVSE